MAGLTTEGFEPKPLPDIQTDLGSGFRTVFGAAITLIAQSVFGLLIGIFSDRLADLWQLGLAIYSASTREGATGIQLDHIGALTGTYRKPATYTLVTLTCAGDDGTVITTGSVVSIPGVGTRFVCLADSAPMSGGETTAEFQCEETGPFAAPAGTVTQIETAISGWDSVTNETDEHTLGTDIETDAAYRVRQVSELRALGSATTAALRAKISTIEGVTDVFVFENIGMVTDGEGLPPKSFEAVVVGGDDEEVAGVIALEKPTGIETYGTQTESVADGNGFLVDTKFSRAQTQNVYVTTNVTVDVTRFPSNGADQIKAAIVAYEVNYHLGSEVRSSALIPSVFSVPGVLELPLPFIGTAASPVSSTTLTLNNRQKADLDTSRIVVNVTPINP